MAILQHVVLSLYLPFIYGSSPLLLDWQSYYLDSFIFIPVLGDCYQLHHHNNITDTCRRESDPETQSCIQWTSEDHNCLGLKTPTNETIVFRCTSHIRFDKCYEVYSADSNVTLVCQQTVHGHGIGITTPDNFTVVYHDSICRTASSTIEKQVYANFVNSFVLDADARSCFKMYTPEQVVTPYNCLGEHIYESCVFNTPEGCTAMMTQNNEVIILDCPEKTKQHSQKHCFELYTFDDKVYTVCQEKLEERCVGVVTPSNITVLFECFYCLDSERITYYNYMKRKIQRSFVKNYLENEYLGRNSHWLTKRYKLRDRNLVGTPSIYGFSYWIPSTSCIGVTLDSKETIILECMFEYEKSEEKGCFPLITPNNEKQSICVKILSEKCVGFVTPKNWSVELACFNTDWNYRTSEYRQRKDPFLKIFSDILNNNYKFNTDRFYYLTSLNEISLNDTKEYKIQNLKGHPNCSGLQTDTEIIVLACTDRKMNGCFDVMSRTNVSRGKEVNSGEQVKNVCLEVLNDKCVGIITPDNWRLTLYCALASTAAPTEDPGLFETLSYSIPDNVPARMKRYAVEK